MPTNRQPKKAATKRATPAAPAKPRTADAADGDGTPTPDPLPIDAERAARRAGTEPAELTGVLTGLLIDPITLNLVTADELALRRRTR